MCREENFEPEGQFDVETNKRMLRSVLAVCGKEGYGRVSIRRSWSFFDNDELPPINPPRVLDHWHEFLCYEDGVMAVRRIWSFDLDLEGMIKETRNAIRNHMWSLVREPHVRMTLQLQGELQQRTRHLLLSHFEHKCQGTMAAHDRFRSAFVNTSSITFPFIQEYSFE
ncbi:hypothetical protein BJ165DRAFT_1400749 [Panaeolus papilionaceus]|nr:hypothetical protein BJ165DRAFT_1400749 [Panaeolus papilionaceus]